MQSYEYILIALSVGQFLAMIIGGYLFLQKPSFEAKKKAEDAADNLENMKTSCQYKHTRIDEIFEEIKASLAGIEKTFWKLQENEFKHIEENSRSVSERMAKMEGQNDIIITLMKDILNRK